MDDFKNLPSQYDHAAAQEKWYPFWESRGYFHAAPEDPREPYVIVIPPPNVTGALHVGHALNNTLQDILIRWKRMQGFNALWMPGTDHAGIATQAVVERRLLEEAKKSRHDLGREGLVDRIWKWKEQYEARILGQLRQLGCSCDWERTRFTLDDVCAKAVREWFFRLFQDGKIYRGKRLVNWDTFLQTAVSDDEVFHETVKGHFWHFKYSVIDPQPGEPDHVTIATTRPETMLGDTAVAVHPDPAAAFAKVDADLKAKLAAAPHKERDEIEKQILRIAEHKQLHLANLEKLRDMAHRGAMLELPLTDRKIPLITDEWAKPELGSGCVKITPAHDANDYDVGQRHPEIGAINIMTSEGTLNDAVPEKYRGLKMHTKAREAVVSDMEAAGLLVDIENREIDLAHSDRSKTPIEPYLADQWFVKMDELAQSAMNAVSDGRVKITPERYAKGYLDWLKEKRDWPIGRQLWWGHRIPVWSLQLRQEEIALRQSNSESDSQWKDQARLVGHMQATGSTVLRLLRERRIALSASEEPIQKKIKEFQSQIDLSHGKPELNHVGEIIEFLRQLFDASGILVCIRNEDDSEAARELERIGNLTRDNDVLDTWFSSALWPHSTLGWPEQTPELKKFYPTSTLVTSRDIITLWVARMVLAGLYNMGEVPFRDVYITPKILDGYGETMSKSKGNGVDPLDVIDKFGADALRFGLAYLTTDTQDVKLPVEFECPHCGGQFPQTKKNRQLPRIECEKCGQPFSTQWAEKPEDKELPRAAVVSERFELGRNFCNKLWNAARFSLINLEGYEPAPVPASNLTIEDRWLLARLATVTEQVTSALDQFRFADAARTLYDFAWNEFCSFYVEMTKARFAVPEQRQVAQRVLAHALDTLLRLLHPMVPFLTEEVWQLLGKVAPVRGVAKPQAAEESVCIAAWPEVNRADQDETIEEQFADFQAVLGAVREVRSRQNITMKEKLTFAVKCNEQAAKLLQPMQPYFAQMARATGTAFGPDATAPDLSASMTLPGMEVYVDVSQFIDVEVERARLTKERDQLAQFAKSMEGKLANQGFVNNAPAEVVQQQRDKLAEVKGQLESIDAALAKLSC